MSVGISLSQFISDNPDPLSSGIPELDQALNNGFQTRSIYEVYGPPGIGKTRFGLQLLEHTDPRDRLLWIETFKPMPGVATAALAAGRKIEKVKITTFTELFFFINALDTSYRLLVMDGMSQLVCNHLYVLQKRAKRSPAHSSNPSSTASWKLHEMKCKHLVQLFTSMTKYANQHNTTIILLNDCMNTSFTNDDVNTGIHEDGLDVIADKTNFYVISAAKRRNVQILKSSLLASSVAMGKRDAKWEIFLKKKIGLFWGWQTTAPLATGTDHTTKAETAATTGATASTSTKPRKCRLVIVNTGKRSRHDADNGDSERGSLQRICTEFDQNGRLRSLNAQNSSQVPKTDTASDEFVFDSQSSVV